MLTKITFIQKIVYKDNFNYFHNYKRYIIEGLGGVQFLIMVNIDSHIFRFCLSPLQEFQPPNQ